MKKAILGVIIIIIIALTVWFLGSKKLVVKTNEPKSEGVEKTSQIIETIPETNPFKSVEINPYKDGYKNPFE